MWIEVDLLSWKFQLFIKNFFVYNFFCLQIIILQYKKKSLPTELIHESIYAQERKIKRLNTCRSTLLLLLGYFEILSASNAYSPAPDKRILISSCWLPATRIPVPSFKTLIVQVFETSCYLRGLICSAQRGSDCIAGLGLEWASSAWLSLARRCRAWTVLHLWHRSWHPCPRGAIWGDLEKPHVCLPFQTHRSKQCLLLLSWWLMSWKPYWSNKIKLKTCLLQGICPRLKAL